MAGATRAGTCAAVVKGKKRRLPCSAALVHRGGKLVQPPENNVRLRTAAQFREFRDVSFYCDLAWEAALRGLPAGPTAHCC